MPPCRIGLVVPVLYLARTASGFRDEQARDAGQHDLIGGLREIPHSFAEWSAGKAVPSSLAVVGSMAKHR